MTESIAIDIHIDSQTMEVFGSAGDLVQRYAVSTAANGAGQEMDSGCTPMGRHVIRAKIGAGQPVNSIFRGRRPTGEIYQCGMREAEPHRDWILTRILWLSGCEPGYNRLQNVDTMRRFIYIHGTPDEVKLGTPGSRGCIRMRNSELLTLFDQVSVGTPVTIHGCIARLGNLRLPLPPMIEGNTTIILLQIRDLRVEHPTTPQ